MRLHPCLFLAAFLFQTIAEASWTQESSGTTAHLTALAFPSRKIGFIAGSDGGILKTTDGGASWSSCYLGPIKPRFTAIAFADTSSGLAVGDSGWIVSTGNGGATWEARRLEGSPDLSAAVFASPSRGLV